MDDLKRIKGRHLKRIREYCGKTQAEFGELLGKWGITSRDGSDGKDAKIIASWESGRRDPPPNVLKAIQENVLFDGMSIRWEYLNGESEAITLLECIPRTTEEASEIIAHSMHILENFNPEQAELWPIITRLLKAKALSEYDLSQIKDKDHFYEFLEAELKRSIESYIKYFNTRKEDPQ